MNERTIEKYFIYFQDTALNTHLYKLYIITVRIFIQSLKNLKTFMNSDGTLVFELLVLITSGRLAYSLRISRWKIKIKTLKLKFSLCVQPFAWRLFADVVDDVAYVRDISCATYFVYDDSWCVLYNNTLYRADNDTIAKWNSN